VSFYSPIDRLAQTLPRPKGTGAEFMTELSKMPGYKMQEAEDRGLQALMNLPKMERAQFMEALKNNPPVMPSIRDTQEKHHESYTLPGGSNYREILLKHPLPQKAFSGVQQHFGGEGNILASVRAKDRIGPNGEKILHIEELQSDWHQQGREKGYTPPDVQKQINNAERAHRKLQQQLREAKQNAAFVESGLSDPTTKRMRDLNPEMIQRLEASKIKHNNTIMELLPQVMKAEAAHQDLLHQSKNTVPDAPFKKNWHEMALKKMIHHAAANGYDSIAITPGAEQADRYGLAKHLGEVQYNHEFKRLAGFDKSGTPVIYHADVEPEQLPNYIGKEVATKLLAQPKNNQEHSLKGVDLQVGGEGMKGFYDKIVPNFLNQFGKKYGAKVGTVPIKSGEEMIFDNAGLGQIRSGKPNIVKLHHFPITPEMREDVTKNGVPLYAKGGEVSRETAMGINVRSDKKANLQYADLIVDGHKTYESRNGDTLRPYVGKRVSIVRTGDGPAKAIGAVTVGEPIVVDRKKFRKMEKQHLVPEGSAFDIASGTKHLYPMHEPERYESERDVGHGIVARKVHMAKGGAVKPVGYTKEQVTVSPNLDAMKYELMSVKRYTKKVK
jgi:hypothetical protein